MSQSKQNFIVQKWVTALSVILFLLKITAYYLTDSLAILSDALESIVNIVAGFIGLYSLYVASKPRDEDHPYGHGKAAFVSAAAEGQKTYFITEKIIIIDKDRRNIFIFILKLNLVVTVQESAPIQLVPKRAQQITPSNIRHPHNPPDIETADNRDGKQDPHL